MQRPSEAADGAAQPEIGFHETDLGPADGGRSIQDQMEDLLAVAVYAEQEHQHDLVGDVARTNVTDHESDQGRRLSIPDQGCHLSTSDQGRRLSTSTATVLRHTATASTSA